MILVGALLVGLPFFSGALAVDPMKSFTVWLGVLSACWWVTWLGVALVFTKRWRAAGVTWIAAGLILGAVSMGLLAYIAGLPPIHFVSNHIESAPDFLGRGGELTEEQVQLHQEVYPNLKPLVLTGSADEVWGKLQAVMAAEPAWQVESESSEELKIKAKCRDRLFGFTDHMVVEVVPLAENVQALHVSMKSEMDLGAGLRRLIRLADRLKEF